MWAPQSRWLAMLELAVLRQVGAVHRQQRVLAIAVAHGNGSSGVGDVRSRAGQPWKPEKGVTVSASILYSFDIVLAVFTVPAGTPMTPAAANERLAGAPGGAASHRCVEAVVFFRGQHAQRCDSPLDRAVWWVQQSSRSCRVRR